MVPDIIHRFITRRWTTQLVQHHQVVGIAVVRLSRNSSNLESRFLNCPDLAGKV